VSGSDAGGKQKTLAEVVRRESNRVHAICYRITNNSDWAAEAFQDTFLRLARWMKAIPVGDSVPEPEDIIGLVQVLAERAATDVLRKHLRVLAHEEIAEAPWAAKVPSIEAALDFDRLLERLPERDRRIIELAYVEGYSSEEIGRLMNLSPIAVRVAKFRNINMLREYLKNIAADVTERG
jgi:RNA polymerase sigma factor (sigma-70 family)